MRILAIPRVGMLLHLFLRQIVEGDATANAPKTTQNNRNKLAKAFNTVVQEKVLAPQVERMLAIPVASVNDYIYDNSSLKRAARFNENGECGKNDDEAQKYADERKLTLHKQQVPMRKLSEIFAENNMNNFGWIMVDVEGAEDIVIPTVDLNSVHADYISYETSNDIDNVIARDHLISAGYQVEFTIGPDKFYMLRQSEQARL